MAASSGFILERDAVMRPYTEDVAAYCVPFSCQDSDLDEFFARDAFLYDAELLGKTYAWINTAEPKQILGLITLANDSVKAKLMAGTARNRLQRSVTNAKRGMSYPAVRIGRLGVSAYYRGKGFDAYNNERTLHFYAKNGFKPLYKSEQEERDFLELSPEEPLKTRFLFYDLKSN